jgi:hypothetical protein
MYKDKVTKSHFLVNSRFNLTAREKDLVTLAMKRLNNEAFRLKEKKIPRLTLSYSFKRQELIDFFGEKDIIALAKSLKTACRTIMEKVGKIENGNNWEFYHLLTGASYKNGILKFQIPENTSQKMLDFSKGYSDPDLRLSLELPSIQEKCILDFIHQFKDGREFSISLAKYGEIVGKSIKDFKIFSDFRRIHIETPIKRLLDRANGLWKVKRGYPKGYVISRAGKSYKDDDIITFKLRYVKPREKSKPIDEKDFIIELDSVFNTINSSDCYEKTYSDLGLNMASLTNFQQHIFDKPEYASAFTKLGMLMKSGGENKK